MLFALAALFASPTSSSQRRTRLKARSPLKTAVNGKWFTEKWWQKVLPFHCWKRQRMAFKWKYFRQFRCSKHWQWSCLFVARAIVAAVHHSKDCRFEIDNLKLHSERAFDARPLRIRHCLLTTRRDQRPYWVTAVTSSGHAASGTLENRLWRKDFRERTKLVEKFATSARFNRAYCPQVKTL